MQLSFWECDEHIVDTECFTTKNDWSPYFVSICVKCRKVFNYPSQDWLVKWPEEQQQRLKDFLLKYEIYMGRR